MSWSKAGFTRKNRGSQRKIVRECPAVSNLWSLKEDHRGVRIGHALPAVDIAALRLQLADAHARTHGGQQHLGDFRGRAGKEFRGAFGLALDHPGLAAVPAIEIDRPVAVEQYVRAGLDRIVLE